jgi:hypothetical protein
MTRALLTALLTLTFVGSSFFSSFTGFESNQLPIPQIDPPIQPAGYAFAIWGLIYGWLIVSAVFGIWKRGTDPEWDAMRTPLIISLALGTPWLWVATQSAIAATVLIFAMAVPAILAMLWTPHDDRWWARMPVSIYAGWLTAASFVSLGSTMAGYGVIFGSTGWAYVGLLMAVAITQFVQVKAPYAPVYGLTVVWALVGIIVANGLSGVTLLAIIGIVAVLSVFIRQLRTAPSHGDTIT